MQKTTAFVGAVIAVGILGGWAFLATQAIPVAHAQVQGACKPGQACKASSFTATAASGSSGVTVSRGSYVSLNTPAQSGGGTNFIYANGGTTVITGSGGINLSGVLTASAISNVAAGLNAFQVNNNGARVDLGNGSLDYLESDGTNVTTPARLIAEGGATVFRAEEVGNIPACAEGLRGLHAVFADGVATDQICWCIWDGASYAWENRSGGVCGT